MAVGYCNRKLSFVAKNLILFIGLKFVLLFNNVMYFIVGIETYES